MAADPKNANTLQLRFSALSPKLKQQLRGFGLLPKVIASLQRKADAITLLHLHSLITDSETHRARRKLFKHARRSVLAAQMLNQIGVGRGR